MNWDSTVLLQSKDGDYSLAEAFGHGDRVPFVEGEVKFVFDVVGDVLMLDWMKDLRPMLLVARGGVLLLDGVGLSTVSCPLWHRTLLLLVIIMLYMHPTSPSSSSSSRRSSQQPPRRVVVVGGWGGWRVWCWVGEEGDGELCLSLSPPLISALSLECSDGWSRYCMGD